MEALLKAYYGLIKALLRLYELTFGRGEPDRLI
jgi:hypothetical protein